MLQQIYNRVMALGSMLLMAAACAGCGAGNFGAAVAGASSPPVLSLSPASAAGEVGQQLSFAPEGAGGSVCTWAAEDQTVLGVEAGGTFLAMSPGTTDVVATCGAAKATATVSVLSQGYSAPVTITKGGTYSGRWKSTDPATPAVIILTDQPVILQNSVVTGPGNLIVANGGPLGIHVQVSNVLGIAVNPNVAGKAKGNFVNVQKGTSVQVDHCTMQAVNAGIVVVDSTPTYLSIKNNIAINVDDRASDGKGGVLAKRPQLGHTIILTNVVAGTGAEIAWNQFINTPGQASVEDIISLYDSRGGSIATPINIHDNYIQGAVSTLGVGYSGGGILTDGQQTNPALITGFVTIHDNQVVITQNYGIGIASGHDVSVHNNRVVSTGRDSTGKWLDASDGNGAAYYLWNFYGSSTFFNNQITGNTGALVRPDAGGVAVRADLLLTSPSVTQNNGASGNTFLGAPGDVSVPTAADQAAELAAWQAKVKAASQALGAPVTLVP